MAYKKIDTHFFMLEKPYYIVYTIYIVGHRKESRG